MRIKKATKKYETWLAKNLTIVPADLALETHPHGCGYFSISACHLLSLGAGVAASLPGFGTGAEVLAVGDLHVENFGTWRDKEGG